MMSKEKPPLDQNLQSLQAWNKVIQAVQQFGSYESVVFDDCLIHAAIHDMGGWIHLCAQAENKLHRYQREFERRYQYAYYCPPKHYPCELIGRINHENSNLGYPLSTPRFLGDQSTALQVYLNGCDPVALKKKKAEAPALEEVGLKNTQTITHPKTSVEPDIQSIAKITGDSV